MQAIQPIYGMLCADRTPAAVTKMDPPASPIRPPRGYGSKDEKQKPGDVNKQPPPPMVLPRMPSVLSVVKEPTPVVAAKPRQYTDDELDRVITAIRNFETSSALIQEKGLAGYAQSIDVSTVGFLSAAGDIFVHHVTQFYNHRKQDPPVCEFGEFMPMCDCTQSISEEGVVCPGVVYSKLFDKQQMLEITKRAVMTIANRMASLSATTGKRELKPGSQAVKKLQSVFPNLTCVNSKHKRKSGKVEGKSSASKSKRKKAKISDVVKEATASLSTGTGKESDGEDADDGKEPSVDEVDPEQSDGEVGDNDADDTSEPARGKKKASAKKKKSRASASRKGSDADDDDVEHEDRAEKQKREMRDDLKGKAFAPSGSYKDAVMDDLGL